MFCLEAQEEALTLGCPEIFKSRSLVWAP